ncbi:MAG: asparagine--tRNA ligase, partial [Cytophagales bacterium]|nr:asparagine--tRNA ligase [Cytophagales bacterium]
MKRTKIKQLLAEGQAGTEVVVKGWVRTKRESRNVAFVALNDGSTIHNLQVVLDPSALAPELLKRVTTGACVAVQGTLAESHGSGQRLELPADELQVLGEAHPEEFPLQPKKHSLEFLREIAYLRP